MSTSLPPTLLTLSLSLSSLRGSKLEAFATHTFPLQLSAWHQIYIHNEQAQHFTCCLAHGYAHKHVNSRAACVLTFACITSYCTRDVRFCFLRAYTLVWCCGYSPVNQNVDWQKSNSDYQLIKQRSKAYAGSSFVAGRICCFSLFCLTVNGIFLYWRTEECHLGLSNKSKVHLCLLSDILSTVHRRN